MADKVEVYLERCSDGVRYSEFTAPPGTPRYTGDPNEKYIEATTDERFRIVVKLLRGFDFMGSPKVLVEYHVDQGNSLCGILSKNKSPTASAPDRSHRENGITWVRRFINGQYMDCGLAFGELKSDDDMDLDNHSIAEQVDRQGRIVVKLRRGHFANQKREGGCGEKSFDPPEHIDTSTTHNKVVHKHHVSHTLKYNQNIILRDFNELTRYRHVPLRPSNMEATAPCRYQRQWVCATGEGSKPIVFTIRYRSREALLALGIIDEDAPVASSSKTGDKTVSYRSRAQEKGRKNVRNRPTAPSLATETIGSSSRSPSKGLTPGPLLSSMMHTQVTDDEDEDCNYDYDDEDDDDDDEELPVKVRSESSDTTEQDSDTSARPSMSPNPSQGGDVLSPTPPKGLTPASSAPPVIHSLLSDDEDDRGNHNSNNNYNEEDHTTFPLFPENDIRKRLALGVRKRQSNNVIDGRDKSPSTIDDISDHGDNGDSASDYQGEMVGPGFATPPRYGGSSLRLINIDLTDQERKRAWSQVEQAEQELLEEEAAAILASEKRERRRQELMDAKRSFLDLD